MKQQGRQSNKGAMWRIGDLGVPRQATRTRCSDKKRKGFRAAAETGWAHAKYVDDEVSGTDWGG